MSINLLNTTPLEKPPLNELILNYLIVEGYESSALRFAQEIGFDFKDQGHHNKSITNGLQSIKQRNEIKKLLNGGEIALIIDKLNEYYPFLLENNDLLYFKILLLNLVEVIKKHRKELDEEAKPRKKLISEPKKKRRLSSFGEKKSRRKSSVVSKLSAKELRKEQEFFSTIISFVKDKLFNKAVKNKAFLQELELAMCLLLFDFDDFQTEEAQYLPKELLNLVNSKSLKLEVFNLINNSILNYNSRFLQVSKQAATEHEKEVETNVVFYDTDSDSDQEKDEFIQEAYSEEKQEDDQLEGFLNNSVNSKFKQLLNLWVWSENVLNQAGEADIRVCLE